jgi:hypothetical protein
MSPHLTGGLTGVLLGIGGARSHLTSGPVPSERLAFSDVEVGQQRGAFKWTTAIMCA